MKTNFEIRIKSFEVAVDKQAWYINRDGNQILKISHAVIKEIVLFVISNVKQLQAKKLLQ